MLELGGLAAGFCGRLFQHAGADVVRLGNVLPGLTDPWVSTAAIERFLHSGKTPADIADRSLLRELVRKADVVIAEGTAAEIESLGWEDLQNIHVAITPFGLTGPKRNWRCSSAVLLAMGGYTYLMGDPDKPPLTLPGHYVEYQSGQYAYIAAAASLYQGKPHSIEISMLETLASLSQMTSVMWTCDGQIRQRHGSSFGVLYPISQFPCADGWFHVNVVPTFWPAFVQMLGAPEVEHDPRFATSQSRVDNADELDVVIHQHLGDKTKAEILALGEQARVPTGVLMTLDEVLDDPHLRERRFFSESQGLRTPGLAYRFHDYPPQASQTEVQDA